VIDSWAVRCKLRLPHHYFLFETRSLISFLRSRRSGIQVEELRDPRKKADVEKRIKEASAKVAVMGADLIIMGCGGMAGMESLVLQGVREAGLADVKVVDAALAGLVFLAGMIATDSPKQ